MRQLLKAVNSLDTNGNPTGGFVKAVGINLKWQDGDLGNPPDIAKHNGAFVESVIECAIGRLRFFQTTRFKHQSNQDAIQFLTDALAALDARTEERKTSGKEGTHKV